MYQELSDLYQNRVFDCTRCRQRLMNPYLHCNPKHDPPNRPEMPGNRRKFQLDYIASKRDIQIVIVGEAPGLDGCGFAGIAFTGEANAVNDLGLPNYHETKAEFQKEQSANLIYGALTAFCTASGISLTAAASKVYLTNAIMCVPLGPSGKAIAAPSIETRRQCRENLVRQVEIIRPRLLVTLGANALGAVTEAFGLEVDGKLTQVVKEQRRSNQGMATRHGFTLLPEIHPSPRNRVLGALYTELPDRLVTIFSSCLL